MKKQLIYLDQSFVSTMAKQLAGQVRSGHSASGQLMGQLHSLLDRLVAANKVLCPRSAVHDQETDLYRRAMPSYPSTYTMSSPNCPMARSS